MLSWLDHRQPRPEVVSRAEKRLQRWNFGVGYRRLSQKIRTDDIRTKFDYDLVALVIGYSM